MDEWDYGIAAWQDAYFCRINWCLLLHTVVPLPTVAGSRRAAPPLARYDAGARGRRARRFI